MKPSNDIPRQRMLRTQQQRLLERHAEFFSDVTRRILDAVPQATGIWCYGLNALNPGRINRSDWDFMVLLPAGTPDAVIDQLNELTSVLGRLNRLDSSYLDVQAMREDETEGDVVRQIRREGFAVWIEGQPVERKPGDLHRLLNLLSQRKYAFQRDRVAETALHV